MSSFFADETIDEEETEIDVNYNINFDFIYQIDGTNPLRPELIGLPTLDIEKMPGETDEELKLRQNRALKKFVEDNLKVSGSGKIIPIRLIPPQLEFLGDVFFKRVDRAILIKNRGGGGSLTAALFMWLAAVFQGRSSVDIAGSKDQARELYRYTKDFWECVPKTKEFLASAPNNTETWLKNSVFIIAIPNAETAARGKHPDILICDEACQSDISKDAVLNSALQSNLTRTNFCTVLLSTFHVAGGLFSDFYYNAEYYGFKIYKWDTFDTMQKCEVGLEHANPNDPLAIESYCKKGVNKGGCPLTIIKKEKDAVTGENKYSFKGCQGKARKSEGFVPFRNVLVQKEINTSLEKFLTEHCSSEPVTEGPIYDAEHLERCFHEVSWEILDRFEEARRFINASPGMKFSAENSYLGHRMSVGIDWGFVGLMACVGPVIRRRSDLDEIDDVIVLQDRGWTGSSTSEMIHYLEEMRNNYGVFTVYADSSHPFNNNELALAGFNIIPVVFNAHKETGIGNTKKFMEKGKLKIHKENCEGLRTTLSKYRRDRKGRIVKREDHYADALMCAMFHFLFESEFMFTIDEEHIKVTLY